MANTCGLLTLPGGRLRPLDSSSLGLGQALRQALRYEPRRVVGGGGGGGGPRPAPRGGGGGGGVG
ncbi:hypothetical protein [Nocardia brasiliensis]|uniref:hypothetical protein n=1 Tax=Nocardia brasiliensis TaxID=37326 RepID=UPI002455678E|nr:hypothetical protein [Nocardia brasiliensis]